MYRRRLFSYTVMLIAGIFASYIALENKEALYACSFLLAVLAACEIAKDTLSDQERASKIYPQFTRGLIIALAIGIASFALSYLKMQPISASELDSLNCVKGEITSIKRTPDKYEFTIRCSDEGALAGEVILCRYYTEDWPEAEHMYQLLGMEVRVYGVPKIPDGARNPRCFDYALYLKSKGIKYTLNTKRVAISKENNKSPYYKFKSVLMEKRARYEEEFSDNPAVYGFIKGVVFGDKSMLDEEIYNEFQENGTAHVLAVSGLHIGFIYGLLKAMSKTRRTLGVALVIAIILILYGELTVWNPATKRAVLILLFGMASFYLRRSFDLLSAISASAMTMLIINPYNLFNVGFEMSFLAVTGIAFAARALKTFVGQYAAFISSVQLATAPFTAAIFNRFSPLTIFINIPIVYAVSLLVPLALVIFGSGLLLGDYPAFMIGAVMWIAEFTIKMNSFLNFDGVFQGNALSINAGALIGIYVISAYLMSESTQVKLIRKDYAAIKRTLLALLIPIAMLTISLWNEFRYDEVVFVDVGQGDAIHIRDGGFNMLIDGGGAYNRNIGESVLRPYLLKNGAEELDVAVLTHLHMDHYQGVRELSECYPVKKYLVANAYREYSELPGKAEFLRFGDELRITDEIFLKVIWPLDDAGGMTARELDENECNMVMILKYSEVKIMITGDLLEEDEADMLEYYENSDELKCDVLKIAHHGSKSSSSEEFLDAVSPSFAVIQVGKNNLYGHPAQEIISKLDARGVMVFRTDESGAIGLDIRGSKIRVDKVID